MAKVGVERGEGKAKGCRAAMARLVFPDALDAAAAPAAASGSRSVQLAQSSQLANSGPRQSPKKAASAPRVGGGRRQSKQPRASLTPRCHSLRPHRHLAAKRRHQTTRPPFFPAHALCFLPVPRSQRQIQNLKFLRRLNCSASFSPTLLVPIPLALCFSSLSCFSGFSGFSARPGRVMV